MPPITEEGLNTFGCKIDGKIWSPYSICDLSTVNPQLLSNVVHILDSIALPVVLNITAQNIRSGGSSFWITGNNYGHSVINGLGNFIDSIDIEYHGNSRIYHSINSSLRDSQYFLITKLDTVNNIISGQFQCKLFSGYDLANSDSLKVTDGRFDFQFAPLVQCRNN